jgi:hypothetical protein
VNADTAEVDQIGVFITGQTFLTFPGAVAAVTTIWQITGKIYPPFADNNLVPVAIAFLVGLVIYLASVKKAETRSQRLSEIGIAIVNTFMIAAAVMGIS